MEKFAQRVPVFHGYPVVLSCVASGCPEPTVTWIYNNKINGNLTITVDNPGEYTCVANNSLGIDTKVVTVVMEGKKYSLLQTLIIHHISVYLSMTPQVVGF